MVKERCWLLDAFKGAFSDSCYNWKTKMALGRLGFVLFYFCFFWNCYLCNAFSVFAQAFHRTVGKMLSKQKQDVIMVAKLRRGSLGAVFSPCSSAVYGHFVLQCVQALFHVAVSLSNKPKKARRKLHRSQKVEKTQRVLLFLTYFEVKFPMLGENSPWRDFQGKAAHLWWLLSSCVWASLHLPR